MGYALEELGPERCAEIAEGLFEVEKKYGEKLHGFCPIHGDKASASFVYVPSGDWYKCRSCQEGGDLVKLWCEVHGLDSRGEGFKAFKAEFVGDTDTRTSPRKPARRQPESPNPEPAPEVFVDEADLEALPPLPADRIAELKRLRCWSPQVIEIMDLREFDDGRNKKIAMPIRDDAGRLCNIRLYQPGADSFKVISWYDRACKACGGRWKVVCTSCGGENFKRVRKSKRCTECDSVPTKVCAGCGGSPNDYGRTRLYPAPKMWTTAPLWLAEGEPDMITALSMGLNAVTQTAGCGTWREEFSEAMAGRDVIIAYDADQAGWKGSHVAAESIVKHAKSVRIIRWPEVMGNG